VCWCSLPKIIKIWPCLSKLQLAKVGAFFETVYCQWHSVTLSEWGKYSITGSLARSPCDSWASCLFQRFAFSPSLNTAIAAKIRCTMEKDNWEAGRCWWRVNEHRRITLITSYAGDAEAGLAGFSTKCRHGVGTKLGTGKWRFGNRYIYSTCCSLDWHIFYVRRLKRLMLH